MAMMTIAARGGLPGGLQTYSVPSSSHHQPGESSKSKKPPRNSSRGGGTTRRVTAYPAPPRIAAVARKTIANAVKNRLPIDVLTLPFRTHRYLFEDFEAESLPSSVVEAGPRSPSIGAICLCASAAQIGRAHV